MESQLNVFKRMLFRWAYPTYDCENCIGMPEYGCYCMAMGASAPGGGPTKLQRLCQWLLETQKPLSGP